MVPVVVFLWLAGGALFMFVLSVLNVPGINEHGTGLLLLLGALVLALVSSFVHIGVVLRRRALDSKS
jgi:hypothetical protein